MAEGLILPYLDVPLQHASPRILKAMKRPADSENALERIRQWRSICPEIAIRSTFITGFPGETEDDFNQLIDFIEEARLDRVGAFAYSDVEGARANELPGMLPLEVREERKSRLLWAQEDISAELLAAKVGQRLLVLVDDVDEEGVRIARSYADAPDIDGLVYVAGSEAMPGDFVEVDITDADTHDLFGDAVTDTAD
jgi:ribosomal protein S12 methylthiotransferase